MQSLSVSKSLNKKGADSIKTKTALGQISFINTLPVVVPLTDAAVETCFTQVFGSPAQLNAKLRKGELQLGAMSSYYFLEDGGFDLFPEISISGTGRVGSVLLFSKLPLAELRGKEISVPETSATSIKLMQLLLKEEYGIEPTLKTNAQPSETLSANLLIGDQALEHDDELSRSQTRVDLAQWWFNRTGLPFVFGVWGARKDWAQDNQTEFRAIGHSLVEASRLGLSSMLPAVIAEAASRTGLTEERLNCYYLHELDYRFTDKHAQALELFGKLCRKHGLL